jgi:hypothetical protein
MEEVLRWNAQSHPHNASSPWQSFINGRPYSEKEWLNGRADWKADDIPFYCGVPTSVPSRCFIVGFRGLYHHAIAGLDWNRHNHDVPSHDC